MGDHLSKTLFSEGCEALNNGRLEEARRLFYRSRAADKHLQAAGYLQYCYLLQSDFRALAGEYQNQHAQTGFSLYTLYWFKVLAGELHDMTELLDKMLESDQYFVRIFALKEYPKYQKITDYTGFIQQKTQFYGFTYNLAVEEQRASVILDHISGRQQLAVLQGKVVLKDYPALPDVYLDFMEIVFSSGNRTSIQDLLKHPVIQRMAQNDYRVMYALARQHYLMGNDDQARQYLVKCSALFRHNPLMHFHLGNLYYKKKQMVKAVAEYEEAVAAAPLFERAYYNLGCAYFQLGDVKRAYSSFDEASGLARRPDTIYNLSACLIEKKELQDAYYYLNKIPSGYPARQKPEWIQEQIKQLVLLT